MAEIRRGADQTALVTGASMGIGADLAECLARDGYDLILIARSERALNDVAHRLSSSYDVKVAVIPMDLSAPRSAIRIAETVASRGLTVDVLVNNAGYGIAGDFAGSDGNAQLGMIDLNVRALVELTHTYWPDILARKRGGVLNVASTAAFLPGPLMAIYYASKAFVLSFSEALWEEARGTGVHVSCLCPGPTKTGFRARAGTANKRIAQSSALMASKPVAEAGYAGFTQNRRVVVTGLDNRFKTAIAPFVPRVIALKMIRDSLSPA
jgi:short-subunit dehydrogenase